MNIEHLRYFIELERYGSITNAAKHLFISPQGLNKAIGVMESKAGVRLVERTKHGTSLTDDGRQFLSFAQATVQSYDELLAQFVRIDPLESGHTSREPLALGATSYSLHTILEPTGSDGLSSIRIEELSPSAILAALAAGTGAHLYVTDLFENSSLAVQALENNAFEPILRTEFGVISHVDYPLDAKSLTPEELLDIPFICFKDESIDWILQRTFGDTQPRSLLLRTSNSEQLIKRVMTKRVVCLLDSFAFHRLEQVGDEMSRSLTFTPVTGMPQVTTGFLYSKQVALEERERSFMQALKLQFNQRYASYARRYPA